LKLHRAIAGDRHGGVGPGVRRRHWPSGSRWMSMRCRDG
jgi:hypothetical protein